METAKPIGRPFQKGQARPANAGRKAGVPNRPKTVRDHIEKRRTQREAALSTLYETDPKRALELDAQMHRDDVAMLKFEQETVQPDGRAESEILRLAKLEGPIPEHELLEAYLRMVHGGDEGRVIAARFGLSDREEPEAVAVRLALGVRALLLDYRVVRQAIEEGKLQPDLTVAQLIQALTPPAAQAPAEPESFQSGDRYMGIPTGAPGHSYIQRVQYTPEPNLDPPAPPRIVEGEVSEPEVYRTIGNVHPQVRRPSFDVEDGQPVDWDSDVPIY